MRELLAARRAELVLPPRDGNSGVGMEFLGFLASTSSSSPLSTNNGVCLSLEHNRALAVAGLAALRSAALQSFALAVAFASRSSIFLLVTWLVVETGVRVVLLLSYAAWCLIFAVGTATMAFA